MRNKKRLSKTILRTTAFLSALSLLSTITPPPSMAKAAYAGKADMIKNSEIIAVVDITKVEKTDEKGSNWTYGQKVTADVETVLKGNPEKHLTIYGGENFICASCRFEPGRALVFLNHNKNLLVGSNWHLSVRPIRENSLEWYDGENMHPLKKMPLNTVLYEIRSNMPRGVKLSPTLDVLLTAKSLDDEVVGESGSPSPYQEAYKKALALQPSASQKEQLQFLTRSASPAGRIYGAMLLWHADEEAGKAALLTLSRDNGTVLYRSGCKGMDVGVWDVAGKLYSDRAYLSLKLAPAKHD